MALQLHGKSLTESLHHNGSPFRWYIGQCSVASHSTHPVVHHNQPADHAPLPSSSQPFFSHWRIFAKKAKFENDVILEGF